MKIVTNGSMREVIVLKHFVIENEEYVLYRNNDYIILGLINQSKILTPSQDKINMLMNIVGNLINNIPINIENRFLLLDNNIESIYEEISYQIINVSQEQINNNQSIVGTPNVVENNPVNNIINDNNSAVPKKKNNTFIYIIIVVVILLLGLLLFLFKDNLFGSNSSGNGGSKNTIDGIEIIDGYKTYALRINNLVRDNGVILEYYELVLRYDNNGNFKYLKITTNDLLTDEDYGNYSDKELQEMLEKQCKNGEELEFEDLKIVCEIKNRIGTHGYMFTDKTINSDFINSKYKNDYILRSILRDFDRELVTEDKVIEWFNDMKESSEANRIEYIIMNNKKVK